MMSELYLVVADIGAARLTMGFSPENPEIINGTITIFRWQVLPSGEIQMERLNREKLPLLEWIPLIPTE